MMIDERKYDEAVSHYRGNPYWDGIYGDAPTALSRRYEGLTFYFSYFVDEMLRHGDMYRDYKKEKDELEEKMGLDDWRYLFKYSADNPFKERCREKVEQLSEDEAQDVRETIGDNMPRHASVSLARAKNVTAHIARRETHDAAGYAVCGKTKKEDVDSHDGGGLASKTRPNDFDGKKDASRLEKA